jgi:hypothetical protein
MQTEMEDMVHSGQKRNRQDLEGSPAMLKVAHGGVKLLQSQTEPTIVFEGKRHLGNIVTPLLERSARESDSDAVGGCTQVCTRMRVCI